MNNLAVKDDARRRDNPEFGIRLVVGDVLGVHVDPERGGYHRAQCG